MNGKEQKACIFAALIITAYAIHQATVGGDGVILGTVLLALGAIGGYAIRGAAESPPAAPPA